MNGPNGFFSVMMTVLSSGASIDDTYCCMIGPARGAYFSAISSSENFTSADENRLAVLPRDALAQVERVLLAVLADVPALRQLRMRLEVRAERDQPVEDLASDDVVVKAGAEVGQQRRGIRGRRLDQRAALDGTGRGAAGRRLPRPVRGAPAGAGALPVTGVPEATGVHAARARAISTTADRRRTCARERVRDRKPGSCHSSSRQDHVDGGFQAFACRGGRSGSLLDDPFVLAQLPRERLDVPRCLVRSGSSEQGSSLDEAPRVERVPVAFGRDAKGLPGVLDRSLVEQLRGRLRRVSPRS